MTIGLPDGYILRVAKGPLVYSIHIIARKTMWCRSLAVTHSSWNLKVGSSSDGHGSLSLEIFFEASFHDIDVLEYNLNTISTV